MKPEVKTRFLLILLFVSMTIMILGQNYHYDTIQKPSHNSLYIEVGGNGYFGSINYDWATRPITKNFKMAFRIGLAPSVVSEPVFPISPISEINLLLGRQKHYFETGFGVNFSSGYTTYQTGPHTGYYTKAELWPFITTRIGYRFQKPEGGFLFRAAITPIITDSFYFGSIWAGVSFGYSF